MGDWISYSTDELAWIEAHKHLARRQLHDTFCARFNRLDVSFENLRALCKRKGWLTGRSGQYEKGRQSENKGKRRPYHANSAATQFKKGQRAINKKAVGYESIDIYGYVQICIDEANPWTGARTRMVHKHRLLWEKANGPVPEGMRLKCLDGDKTNTDPANWEPISMALAPRLNGKFGMGYDQAEPEVKPTILAIAKLEHAARQARKTKAESQITTLLGPRPPQPMR
jgi:hypothetical protein